MVHLHGYSISKTSNKQKNDGSPSWLLHLEDIKEKNKIVDALRVRPRPSGSVHPNPLSSCDVESKLLHTVCHHYRSSCGMARLKDMMQEVPDEPLAFLT